MSEQGTPTIELSGASTSGNGAGPHHMSQSSPGGVPSLACGFSSPPPLLKMILSRGSSPFFRPTCVKNATKPR